MASSARQSFTVLMDEDGVRGSKFERDPEYTVDREVQRIEIEREAR